MNKKQTARVERLMPNGVPRYVRIYDNGGVDAKDGTVDRFTVVFTGGYRHIGCGRGERPQSWFQEVCMSESPFHPQGFCQHGEHSFQIDARNGWAPAVGRRCHLGKRISFAQLPKDCQTIVIQDYKEIWVLDPD